MRAVLAMLGLACCTAAPARGEGVIRVRADRALGQVSRLLTGACLEDVNHEVYGGLYSQMVFGESFQEPAPAPVIRGFQAYGGRWTAQDGTLHASGADGPKLVSDHAPFQDGAAGVEMLFADRQGQSAGLIVRVRRPGLGADRFTGYEVALDPARQVLRLGRHRDDFQLIRDVPCEVPVGRWIALEVRLSGPVVEVLVDGRTMLRHDDGADELPSGTVGLRPWYSAAAYRRLWVRTGDRAVPLPFEQAPSPDAGVSGMWRPVRRGSASGRFALVSDRPFVGAQSQLVRMDSGKGEWGVENRGLNRWGLAFAAGKPYEGRVWARAARPTVLYASFESGDGTRTYAMAPLRLAAGGWRLLDFTLRPRASGTGGRLSLTLRQPGTVALGYVSLQPGAWGRFRGLPVRRDVADALVSEGLTVLRYGGSMVNSPAYRWKKMVGPRDRRPPYAGTWYPYSSNGWGIADFMAFCEAAGFEYVPAFNMGETPGDMADFVEYARGGPGTRWGRQRATDGHPRPYRLRFLELGNEERVDEAYFARFKPLAEAIWARDPDIILVVGDLVYNRRIVDPYRFGGGAVSTLAAHRKILELAKAHGREVWFDVHVGTEAPPEPGDLAGPRSLVEQLGRICPGARYRVVVFELNAGNHAMRRALSNALALNAFERDGQFPVVCSANCLQPDGQNDNGWDQGLLFLDPSRVWLQPPGYVAQMVAQSHQPIRVRCTVEGAGLDTVAARSRGGRTLVLRVVNPGGAAVPARIVLSGFAPRRPDAIVVELSAPPNAVNTADRPHAVVPRPSRWRYGTRPGDVRRTFAPHSFTVLRFE